MFVVTADQRGSRTDRDRVDEAIAEVDRALHRADGRPVRAFARTAGDEIQALFDDPHAVLITVDTLVGAGHWRVGVGVGAVDTPIPDDVRAGRGAAFIHARAAVTAAHRERRQVAVVGDDPDTARDAHTAVTALLTVIAGRSELGNQAIDLIRAGLSQSDAAGTLGISTQAVSQRLQTAEWELEKQLRQLSVRLLAAADCTTGTAAPDHSDSGGRRT